MSTSFSINTTLGMTSTLRKPAKVVALDLDETTGFWGPGSLLFKVFKVFRKQPPPTALFVQSYMEKGGARPYLRDLLQTLREWKESGRIDEVAIFTSASNSDGWIDYLTMCLGEYSECAGLFGRSIVREDAPEVSTGGGDIRTQKDLSRLSKDPNTVVLIDDKPKYALNGRVIAVPEYRQGQFDDEIFEVAKTEFPEHASKISDALKLDRASFPPSTEDFSGDTALLAAIEQLTQLFPNPQTHV